MNARGKRRSSRKRTRRLAQKLGATMKPIIERLQCGIETAKENLINYSVLLERVKNLPFKEGDVVKHPDYGNCIILNILITNFDDHVGLTTDEEIVYEIMCREGTEQVPISEVLPYNDMSKILYDESNG